MKPPARFFTAAMLDALKTVDRPRRRANIHESSADLVQRMVYMQRKGEHLPPHSNSRELTKIILEGESELVIYDDMGGRMESWIIKPGGIFCYTLPAGTWHSNFNVSEVCVFFEVMNGPYPKDDVKFLEIELSVGHIPDLGAAA